MKTPRVAVILCTYNMARYLPEALESALGLRYPELDVVVVDDGSTDETPELIRSKYRDRVRYVRQANQGLFAARNAGAAAAPEADYYSIMDADDRIHPLKVWDEVAFLERHPHVVFCFSNLVSFRADSDNSWLVWQGRDLLGGDAAWGEIANPIEKIAKCNAFTSVATIRAAALRAVGFYDDTLRCSGDMDLAIRITRVGGFGFINKPRYFWRCEDQGMTSYVRDRILVYMRIFEKVWQDPAGYRPGELLLLKQFEGECLSRGLRGIVRGKYDPQLLEYIGTKMRAEGYRMAGAKVWLAKAIMALGLAPFLSAWGARRQRNRRNRTKKADMEAILRDLTPCFDRVSP